LETALKRSDLVIPAAMRGMYDDFHFAPAVRAGDLLLCSGQIGIGPDGRAITDPEAQFDAAFAAVGAVLGGAGLGFADVVEMTTFHVGLREHLGAFMRAKDRVLPEPFPAWTAIGVSELAVPGGLAEVRVTAQLRRRPASAGAKPKRKAAAKRAGGRRAPRRR
jgi:enamine deaminase RidA (YjgF/YER057c/UK114 family)